MIPQTLEETIRWSVEAAVNDVIFLLWGIVYAIIFTLWYYGGYVLLIALAGYILYQLTQSAKQGGI